MFDFDTARRVVLGSVGALILSTAALATATAPARASVTPVAGWQQSVDRSIAHTLRSPLGVDGTMRAATVAVSLAADGTFAGARIANTSGDPAVDAEALRTARKVAYPALPAALAGKPTTVTMKLFFGDDADIAAEQVRRASDYAAG